MKLSKNVLVGSLATVGMVLGAIAPALTAQAATTTGKVNNDGSVTKVDGFPTPADAAQNGGLAIAYDAGNGTDAGSATMASNANVKVVSGLLVLDAVPDFGFGSAAAGTTVGLVNNQYAQKEADSTNADAVKVTESRTAAPGFTLGAQISNFTSANDTTGQAYTLNLQPTSLTDDQGNSVSSVQTNNVSLSGADSDPATLVDLAAGSYKEGQVNASFKPGDKNVFLTLGKDASTTTADKASVKAYNAKITWTLTAKPSKTTTPAG
ncbi:WxL domain-containing protein [Companilactobacillus musae]|uniref:WxL domain-containing protein n=1 Tax=Companilactobacillus musae TaxID=1903258 RepID=UPI00341F9773